MKIVLFDGPCRNKLLPLTYTRPVGDLRIGILTIKEKWERYLSKHGDFTVCFRTEDYLSEKFGGSFDGEAVYIDGAVVPNQALVDQVITLAKGAVLSCNGPVIAAKCDSDEFDSLYNSSPEATEISDLIYISNTWDIFLNNDRAIREDFQLVTNGRESAKADENTTVIGNDVFIEDGAQVMCSILNSETGPIYIGKEAQVMEGSMIRGGLALCEGSTLKMGTKIYGPTTVGPHSKVGGEVTNSIIQGYSNKGHDGFVGNSVIGEWCNLGADTNTSNLKNNYSSVKVWSYEQESLIDTGQQFCGLLMGDHSKCGINTMFNTGTSVGVSANVFGGGFPDKFIPSFSWGGSDGFETFKIEKALELASAVMKRRGIELNDADKKILEHVFELSSGQQAQ